MQITVVVTLMSAIMSTLSAALPVESGTELLPRLSLANLTSGDNVERPRLRTTIVDPATATKTMGPPILPRHDTDKEPISKALTAPGELNCRGSSGCHNLFSTHKSHDLRKNFDAIMQIDLNRIFKDDEPIACSQKICVFAHNTETGLSGLEVRELLFKLLGRCNVCGRVSVRTLVPNAPKYAELRVDQVMNQYPLYCVGLCYLGNRTDTLMVGGDGKW